MTNGFGHFKTYYFAASLPLAIPARIRGAATDFAGLQAITATRTVPVAVGIGVRRGIPSAGMDQE